MEALLSLVAAFPRVKGVGVGHSWWQQQFCAGNTSDHLPHPRPLPGHNHAQMRYDARGLCPNYASVP